MFAWAFYLGLGLCFWSDPLDQLHYFDFVYIELEHYIPLDENNPKAELQKQALPVATSNGK